LSDVCLSGQVGVCNGLVARHGTISKSLVCTCAGWPHVRNGWVRECADGFLAQCVLAHSCSILLPEVGLSNTNGLLAVAMMNNIAVVPTLLVVLQPYSTLEDLLSIYWPTAAGSSCTCDGTSPQSLHTPTKLTSSATNTLAQDLPNSAENPKHMRYTAGSA
jgi:hypothetical protein